MHSTLIPTPRTPPFDNTGKFSREWYLFFYNLFKLTSDGGNTVSITDLLIQPHLDMGGVDAEIRRAQREQITVNSGLQDQLAQTIKDLQASSLRPHPPEVTPPVNRITDTTTSRTFDWDEAGINATVTGLTITLPKATYGGADRTVTQNVVGSVTIAPGGSDTIILPTTDTTITIYNKGDSLTFRPINSTTWAIV